MPDDEKTRQLITEKQNVAAVESGMQIMNIYFIVNKLGHYLYNICLICLIFVGKKETHGVHLIK